MADAKISQLTGATTPLDGTEVLPIVQSGATKKVANNDLRPKQIQSNATSGVLQVAGPAAATTRVMTVPNANFTAARTDAAQTFTGDQAISGNLSTISSTDANTNATVVTLNKNITNSEAFVIVKDTASAASAGFAVNRNGLDAFLRFYATNASGVLTQFGVLDGASGNLKLDTGNLIQGTANKGVNFTANTPAAGMTSQLLNWYEEGTWTPVVTSDSGTITSYTAGQCTYVKIGALVSIRFAVTVTNVGTAAGSMKVAGLPFTSFDYSDNGKASTCLVREDSLTGIAYQGFVTDNSTNLFIVTTGGGGVNWTNNVTYVLECTYRAA